MSVGASLIDVVATGLGVIATLLVVVGALWKWVVLPNLREQLFRPVEETRRQVVENKHANTPPTVLDKIDDVAAQLVDLAATVDAVALTQGAVLRVAARLRKVEQSLGEHLAAAGEAERRIWLLLESLVHEEHAQQEGKTDDERDQGSKA